MQPMQPVFCFLYSLWYNHHTMPKRKNPTITQIKKAIENNRGNVAGACRELGIPTYTFYNRYYKRLKDYLDESREAKQALLSELAHERLLEALTPPPKRPVFGQRYNDLTLKDQAYLALKALELLDKTTDPHAGELPSIEVVDTYQEAVGKHQ
jgi:hypothetical protein